MFLRATDGPDGDGKSKSSSSVGNDIKTLSNQGNQGLFAMTVKNPETSEFLTSSPQSLDSNASVRS